VSASLRKSARLLRLGLPIAAGRLGIVAMGVVDTVAVGQLAPRDLAAQSLGWVINGPALIGGLGLLLGVQILTARAAGSGNEGTALAIWKRGLVVGVVAGVLVCAIVWGVGPRLLGGLGVPGGLAARGARVAAVLTLSIPFHLVFMASAKMLEALEQPVPGAVAMWIANAVNLALNLALTPSCGAVGSAWATVLSRLALAIGMAAFVVAAPSLRRFRGGESPVEGYGPLLRIGVAAALSGLTEAAAFASMSVIAARSGGATAVAVWSIATGGLVTLVFLLAQGLSTAGVVLVSEAVGAGDARAARETGWLSIGLTVAAMSACGVASALLAPWVVTLFTTDPAVRASLAAVMGFVALLMVSDGGQGATDAILRARGDNIFPTAVRMIAYALVAPMVALILAGGLRTAAVFVAILAASWGAWLPMLTRLAIRDLSASRSHERTLTA
jgi:MATE family multidrug resistance protein